jgi:hypothetical protein
VQYRPLLEIAGCCRGYSAPLRLAALDTSPASGARTKACAMTDPTAQDWLPRLFHADKLPMILQAEAAECGLACLAMVAAANGQRHSLQEV